MSTSAEHRTPDHTTARVMARHRLGFTDMSWVPLAATVVGAVIGLGASLLTDHLRWGRERTDRSLTARREVYAAYLTSLHTANQALRASALGDRPGDQPLGLYARAVFREAGVVQARERLVLIAPEPVVRAGGDAFESLRVLRDAVGQGQALTEYDPQLRIYGDHLQSLRDAMRKDLHVTGPSVKIPL